MRWTSVFSVVTSGVGGTVVEEAGDDQPAQLSGRSVTAMLVSSPTPASARLFPTREDGAVINV